MLYKRPIIAYCRIVASFCFPSPTHANALHDHALAHGGQRKRHVCAVLPLHPAKTLVFEGVREAVGDEGGAMVGGELVDGDVEVGEVDGVAEVEGVVGAAEDGVEGGEVAVLGADE